MAVPGVDIVCVATDDERIAETCRGFGAEVVMTSTACRNGTERCAEALAAMPEKPEVILNLQGDAPLTPPWFLENLIAALRQNEEFDAATPILKCDDNTLQRLQNDREYGRIGGPTAVFDATGRALYFSKEVIPHGPGDKYHHVGVYAYRPAILAAYLNWPEGNLEQSEGLEQLRFLENGRDMLCVEVDAKGKEFWEVNNPEDITMVEEMLRTYND